jgi:hypothetical protein
MVGSLWTERALRGALALHEPKCFVRDDTGRSYERLIEMDITARDRLPGVTESHPATAPAGSKREQSWRRSNSISLISAFTVDSHESQPILAISC